MKTVTYDETTHRLVPVDPVPEQIAAAAAAAWPVASVKDIEAAKIAARLLLMNHMDAAPGVSLDEIAEICGPSYHHHARRFRKQYGQDDELLEIQNQLIALRARSAGAP